MNRNIYIGIILVILISILAIVYFLMFNENVKTYEGVYTQGYNVTDFQPCDMNEHWWLSFKENAGNIDSMYKAIIPKSTRKTFIRFKGKEVYNSEQGHVGYYDRNFEVAQIDTLRTLLRKDCR